MESELKRRLLAKVEATCELALQARQIRRTRNAGIQAIPSVRQAMEREAASLMAEARKFADQVDDEFRQARGRVG
jgi:hypothetical protein